MHAGDKPFVCAICENCENEVEWLNDDDLCEDCENEAGIARMECLNDRD